MARSTTLDDGSARDGDRATAGRVAQRRTRRRTEPVAGVAETPRDSSLLSSLAVAFQLSQCLYVAAELGVADALLDGPLDHEELARRTGSHAPALRRLLRALASEGVFDEDATGHFALTPLSRRLLRDAPDSLRDTLIGWLCLEPAYRAFGGLLHTVRTGEPALEVVAGLDLPAYLQANPAVSARYHAAIGSGVADLEASLAVYGFSAVKTAVDVGGGRGILLDFLLRRYPAMRGILFDLPAVIDDVRADLAHGDLAGRIRLVAGDFFQSVPIGGDLYILSSVLHGFNDAEAARILRCCRRAMSRRSRLIIYESVVPPGRAIAPLAMADLRALVLEGGGERTEEAFAALLARADLRLDRVLPLRLPLAILEATPV